MADKLSLEEIFTVIIALEDSIKGFEKKIKEIAESKAMNLTVDVKKRLIASYESKITAYSALKEKVRNQHDPYMETAADYNEGPDVVDQDGIRKCRECGCTDDRACLTSFGPCWWIEPDLCSNCDCTKN